LPLLHHHGSHARHATGLPGGRLRARRRGHPPLAPRPAPAHPRGSGRRQRATRRRPRLILRNTLGQTRATVADPLVAIDQIAPFRLAESWDNVGLLAGNPDSECQRVLVALEVTPEVIDEAIARDTQAIVAHHPLIFRPLKSIADTTPQ